MHNVIVVVCLSEYVSECKICGSVAQHRVLVWQAGFQCHGRTTTRGLKNILGESAAFVIQRMTITD